MTRLEAKAGMNNRTKLQSLCEMRCQLQNEVYRWKTQWDMMNVAERRDILDDTIQ